MTPHASRDRHLLLVLSNAVEGREQECDEWYAETHIPEVCALPGFVGARRFRLNGAGLEGFEPPGHRYVALYEIEGPPQDALDALQAASGEGRIVLSQALDLDMRAWCYEQIAAHTPAAEEERS